MHFINWKNLLFPIYNEIKERFRPAISQSLVGKFIEDPVLNVPDYDQVIEFSRKKAVNILQNFTELEDFELETIVKNLIDFARDQKSRNYFQEIINNKDLVDKVEKQLKDDIKSNPFELAITNESIIFDNFEKEYNELKEKCIKEKINIQECFLYHGTKQENHKIH